MPWKEEHSEDSKTVTWSFFEVEDESSELNTNRTTGSGGFYNKLIAPFLAPKPVPKPIPLIDKFSIEELPDNFYKISVTTRVLHGLEERLNDDEFGRPITSIEKQGDSAIISLCSNNRKYLLKFIQSLISFFAPLKDLDKSANNFIRIHMNDHGQSAWAQFNASLPLNTVLEAPGITQGEPNVSYACTSKESAIKSVSIYGPHNNRLGTSIVHFVYKDSTTPFNMLIEFLRILQFSQFCKFWTMLPTKAKGNGVAFEVPKNWLQLFFRLAAAYHPPLKELPEAQEPEPQPSAFSQMLNSFAIYVKKTNDDAQKYVKENKALTASACLLAFLLAAYKKLPEIQEAARVTRVIRNKLKI